MSVKGFKASAFAGGLRYKDRFDLGLIVADKPAAVAGVFTQNIAKAAPVIWSATQIAKGYSRAFLVNAGQANAQTGDAGLNDCRTLAENLGASLNFSPEEVLLASTGVIGQPINMPPFLAALPQLTAGLKTDGLNDFAQAIMTTDTFAKTAGKEVEIGGQKIAIWGAAKGSGMIAPNMATMLGFVLTDAQVSPALLASLLKEGANLTFNRVTVDGDTSTNDSLMMMASGAAGAPEIIKGEELSIFKEALFDILAQLARQIAFDGEGATHLIVVRVKGAKNEMDARLAARTVAESPLVKTAFYGRDANWGRILMALGRSGAKFDPYKVDIDLNDTPWIRAGLDSGNEEAVNKIMALREYDLNIDLKAGEAGYFIYTCDFSHDYVSINGSYRS